MYLVYTVNDPRAAQVAARKANVVIADPVSLRREILFDYPGFIFHLVPSPDGKRVAFVAGARASDGSEARDLFLFDLAAGRYTDVSASGHFSRAVKTAPVFSPDGSSALFLSQQAVNAGEFNIFKCDTESGRIGGLYTDPVEDVPLTMMPDGRHCVAVRRVTGVPGSFEYISVDIGNGAATVLHRFDETTKVGPAFFDPAGTTLYCDTKPANSGSTVLGGVPSREVLSINLATGASTLILDPTKVSYIYQVYQEALESEETPMTRISICRADGSDFQYLTGTDARCYFLQPPSNIPPLSPDYSLIFYYRQDPVFQNEDIWVMKRDGSDPVNVSNTAGYPEGSAGWMVIKADPGA
jgi:Tol biopolymer transport system component